MTRDWKPIKVAVLDLQDLPGTISEHERYGAIWALIREHGRPRGWSRSPSIVAPRVDFDCDDGWESCPR